MTLSTYLTLSNYNIEIDMLKKIILPSILVILGYGFWISPNFKEIAAGVAIFLFGMLSLEQGFKSFTGGLLEKILTLSTDRGWKSFGFGVLSTTVMQSSSLVSVITISFLSAGLIDLAAGIGIIFGANIGTTTGAWLVAGLGLKVKISAYAMPMLVFGVVLMFQKSNSWKGTGYILAGLGFLFLGIHHMKEGFEAFKETIDLAQYAVEGYAGLFLFAAIGVAATVIMQSSHATLVLIITALAAGQITYPNALALAIGANVGTTITAIMGAMGSSTDGKRLAGAHLIFNVSTGMIAIVFMQQFLTAVDWTSSLVGIRHDDYTLKLAVFHTLFNMAGVIVMLPFIDRLVHFLCRIIKHQKKTQMEPLYLVEASIEFPETAIESIRKETLHVYALTYKLLANSLALKKKYLRTSDKIKTILNTRRKFYNTDIDTFYGEKVKGIYSQIIAFISKASFVWGEQNAEVVHWLRTANKRIIEAIKGMKHLQKNLLIHMNSNDPEIRRYYNRMRAEIAVVLRDVDIIWSQLERGMNDNSIEQKLDELLVVTKKHKEKVNRQLIKSLHREKLSPEMGTSIMNDIHYTFSITHNLITVWQTLLAVYDEYPVSAEREVNLDAIKFEYDVVTTGHS